MNLASVRERPDTSGDAQLELFRGNRSAPGAHQYARMLETERNWVVRLAEDEELRAPELATHADLITALNELLAKEESNPSESERFLAEYATREQFAVVVSEFAIDALIESQSLIPAIQRLPHRAQMAVVRVIIDEFGCGSLEQSHAQLYRKLLGELQLPSDHGYYEEIVSCESLQVANLFYWLSTRAPRPEYFLGGLAYFEMSTLYAFRCFVTACDRLGIRNSRYYTEHLHIDNFHKKEMYRAIEEFAAEEAVDFRKMWVGARLASDIIGRAVEAAVARARLVVQS